MTFLHIDDYLIEGLPLKVVRDDLFPFIGGGSKARKAVEYEKYLKAGGYNAVVTCGGIPLDAIDKNTLESKTTPHLFYAGEVLDIDGITGGFNFQAAWSTA